MFVWFTEYQLDRLLETLRNVKGFPGNAKLDWLRGIVVSLEQSRLMHKQFPKIICLCGSRRFYRIYRRIEADLTLKGNLVLTPGYYPKDDEYFPEIEVDVDQLTALYNRKIDLCDELYVINENGFVGDRTKAKILYAHSLGKKVEFMDEGSIPDWYKDLSEGLEF